MEYWSQVIKSQRARKSLSALNVFGLSVCVSAALLIMLYVRFELSFDSFHDGDRIYRVESRLYEGATLTDIGRRLLSGMLPPCIARFRA